MARLAVRRGIAVAALAGAIGGGAAAATASHPDLSGVWERPETDGRGFDGTVANLDDQRPPLNATWAREWRIIRQRARAGMKVWDPTFACLPPGMPRTMVAPYPFEIIDSPGRLTVLTEFYNETRRIWTDGRGHPGAEDLEPTFSGDSIARWEGDTLVIDTTGLRYETVIDTSGVPHSDQLHITERVLRTRPDELEWTTTLTDPVVFERPWTVTRRFHRSPPGTAVREYVCAENNPPDPYVPSPDDPKYARPDPRLKTMP